MKLFKLSKTFVVACFLGTFSQVNAAELIYGFDFTGLNPGQAFNNISTAPGTTPITKTGGGWSNYNLVELPSLLNENGTVAYVGLSHQLNNQSFKISDPSGISGLSLSEGFSLSTHIYKGSTAWRDVFSFTIAGCVDSSLNGEYKLENNGATNWNLYGPGSLAINLISSAPIAANTWAHYGFNITSAGLEIYINGTQQTLNNNFGFGTGAYVTSIQGGSSSGSNGLVITNNHLLSQFGVYDGTLKQEDYAYLSTHVLKQSIPEPATATLGILALSGLMLRRRRQG